LGTLKEIFDKYPQVSGHPSIQIFIQHGYGSLIEVSMPTKLRTISLLKPKKNPQTTGRCSSSWAYQNKLTYTQLHLFTF